MDIEDRISTKTILDSHKEALGHKKAPDYFEGASREKSIKMFYGIAQIYEAMQEERASRLNSDNEKLLIFFPWRGAGPIYWMLDQYYKEKNAKDSLGAFAYLSFPPVGTGTDLYQPGLNVGGIDIDQKRAILKSELLTVFEPAPKGLGLRNNIKGIVLIDEVQKGGTLTQFFDTLVDTTNELTLNPKLQNVEALNAIPVTVLAIQDEGVFGKQKPVPKFRELSEKPNTSRLSFQAIPMPLFVDVEPILPVIFHLPKREALRRAADNDTDKLKTPELRESWKNEEAEAAFRNFISLSYKSIQKK